MGLTPRYLFFVLAAALPLWASAADRPEAPESVRDLVYGEILFDFYQDRYLDAITTYLVAVEKQSLDFHRDEAELLAGGMYLAYGQHDQAEHVFDRLLEDGADEHVQQRARIQLAWARYRRGQLDATLASLNGHVFDGDNAIEALSLQARAHLGLRNYDAAAGVLTGLEATEERSFAMYNLGVAAAGQGDLGTATAYLQAVGNTPVQPRRSWLRPWRKPDPGDPALPGLRDKARLALGLTLIRNGRSEAAMDVLESIDSQGPYASAALLGVGWAAAEVYNFELALSAWTALRERDSADPAVQEAWFAIPYALGELDAYREAATAFETSIAAIEAEDRALADAVDYLERDGLAAALLANEERPDWSADWRLETAPDHPLSRYLFLLLADHQVQQHLRDFRDLSAMRELLERKRDDIDSYVHMLETRHQRFVVNTPAAGDAGREQIDRLQATARALQQRLTRVEETADPLLLATAREQEQLAILDGVGERAMQLPADQATALLARQRVLAGVLAWKLSHEYAGRLHEVRSDLAETSEALALAERRHASVMTALHGVPRQVDHFEARIDAVSPRISQMLLRLDATLHSTDRALVALATGELNARRARLAQYLDQAHYALAALYDQAAAEGS